MTIRQITVGAVIAELLLFIALAVLLQPEPRALPARTAEPPKFEGSFQHFTAFSPRRPTPEATITDGDGRPLGLDAFAGKVVVLNFWATWCAPCKREMPDLDRLQAALGGPDFAVVTVSIDRKGREVVEPWMRSAKLEHLAMYLDPGSKLLRAFGGRGLPTTYILDRKGFVAGMIEGPAEWNADEARALVRFYLAESGAEG
ncbi:MAG: TlpA disulfide reductase family protein [Alphaproteobacteria bacterium]|nr:TlpA disulfide reductase family protein [Alphaproteobacteria bacterium]